MSTQTVCRISGRDKAAMLLLALGPAQSAEVLSRLDPHQVAAISQRFARLRDLGAVDTTPVVAEFERLAVSAPPERPPSRIPDRQTPATASIEPPPCATEAVRDFDLSKLERFPSRSLQAAHRARPRDPERFADLPVRCRAELAAVELPLAALANLGVDDVLVLDADTIPQVELVGGEGVRLAGRLSMLGERLAVELAAR